MPNREQGLSPEICLGVDVEVGTRLGTPSRSQQVIPLRGGVVLERRGGGALFLLAAYPLAERVPVCSLFSIHPTK